MSKVSSKERTLNEFMKRFDRDEDLANPFVVGMKMLISSLISSKGITTALPPLNVCLCSENIIVYNYDFKVIASVNKYSASLTKLVKSHTKAHKNKEFYEEFEAFVSRKKRNIIIYSVHTANSCYYIVIVDSDVLDENLKKDIIDSSKITFYTIFDHYELVNQLKIASQVDALTGVKNRFMYQNVTKKLNKFAKEITFIVCDIFSLKKINDTYGHPAGDIYLRCAAKYMEEQFPKCVYKVGGDEFIIIVPGTVDVSKKMSIANQNLSKAMKKAIKKSNEVYYINYGCFYGNTSEITAIQFYLNADKNLSKDKGDFYSQLGIDRRKR